MISLRTAVALVLCVVSLQAATGKESSSSELETGRFHWRAALIQSGLFLGIQHGFRLATEEGARNELKGPFFPDYFRSVRSLRGWGDGDPFLVNYIGHPMMGAVTGYIQIQNDAEGRIQQFGSSPDYWKSRMHALAWSAAYSLQFELGPISEASIGNVGKKPGTMGMVDLVVTPIAGTGWLAAEDALDRYVITKLEKMSLNRGWKIIVRSFLNPDRSFANVMRWKVPWHRDTREGVNAQAAARE